MAVDIVSEFPGTIHQMDVDAFTLRRHPALAVSVMAERLGGRLNPTETLSVTYAPDSSSDPWFKVVTEDLAEARAAYAEAWLRAMSDAGDPGIDAAETLDAIAPASPELARHLVMMVAYCRANLPDADALLVAVRQEVEDAIEAGPSR